MNPFSPGFGKVPPIYLDRSEDVQKILTPLNLWDVKDSYAKAFKGKRKISEKDLLQITKLTCGYAYAFQLLGYYLWENSSDEITDKTIQNVLPMYKTDLYRNAYLKMYQSLSNMEQLFLNTMGSFSNEEISVSEIGKKMQKPKNYISIYRRRLLDTQLIVVPRRGYLKFSLPFFKDFLEEVQYLY